MNSLRTADILSGWGRLGAAAGKLWPRSHRAMPLVQMPCSPGATSKMVVSTYSLVIPEKPGHPKDPPFILSWYRFQRIRGFSVDSFLEYGKIWKAQTWMILDVESIHGPATPATCSRLVEEVHLDLRTFDVIIRLCNRQGTAEADIVGPLSVMFSDGSWRSMKCLVDPCLCP